MFSFSEWECVKSPHRGHVWKPFSCSLESVISLMNNDQAPFCFAQPPHNDPNASHRTVTYVPAWVSEGRGGYALAMGRKGLNAG